MSRTRKLAVVLGLMATPWLLFQCFFFIVQRPLNDALIEAVKRNDIAKVAQLLEAGADVNSRERATFMNHSGQIQSPKLSTPLILSFIAFEHIDYQSDTTHSRAAIRSLLLKHGADARLSNRFGLQPLHLAASRGDLAMVKTFLERGADVNARDSSGNTALMKCVNYRATKYNGTAIVTLLLSRGVQVNARNNDGESALMKAASNGALEVVVQLIAYGADVNARDNLGLSVLGRSLQKGSNGRIARELLKHGADVNIRDRHNATPLHHVIADRSVNLVRFLLQNGADVNARDNLGRTPLEMTSAYLNSLPSQRRENQSKPPKILPR